MEYNVFNLDQSEPWKYKFIPDKGRIPVRKEKPIYKRSLSIPSKHSDDEEEGSASSDGRKRSKLGSLFLSPSQCSARKSGSIVSLKKSNGSKRTSVNLENEDFEFEFAMDSDGFIKNKDYKLYNYQIPTMDNDEDYDDYDDFDEDTMNVEELPNDAEFEWCWGEDGNLKIYEIGKSGPQDEIADERADMIFYKEQAFLGQSETEMCLDEPISEIITAESKKVLISTHKTVQHNLLAQDSAESTNIVPVAEIVVANNKEKAEEDTAAEIQEPDDGTVSICKSGGRSRSRSKNKAVSPHLSRNEEQEESTSSRRAMKRPAQVTPPPTTEDADIQARLTRTSIPKKTSKPDFKLNNTSKIAGDSTSLEDVSNIENKLTKPSFAVNTEKRLETVVSAPKTQIVEVFEYDPLLGYCTVKRKIVPTNDCEMNQSSLSADDSLQKITNSENVPDPTEEEQKHMQKIKPPIIINLENNIFPHNSTLSQKKDEGSQNSNSSSKENKAPNKSKSTGLDSLIPLSSMEKYDLSVLGPLLSFRSIPQPPKCKPPSLPESVNSLMGQKVNRSLSNLNAEVFTTLESKTRPNKNIKVELSKEKSTAVSVTISKPGKPSSGQSGGGKAEESADWYWDYEENCWKECDPEEEYEWEYIEEDEEKQLNAKQNPTVTVSVNINKSLDNKITASFKESDPSDKLGVQRNTRNESKLGGSEDLSDSEDVSPFPSFAIKQDKDLEKDRKHASKWGKNRKRSGKISRQNSADDELSDSESLKNEDLLDVASRRRRKGTVDPPSKHSLYDTNYYDEEHSVSEISQRARRRRKDTLEDDKSGETRAQDERLNPEKSDAQIKRRNTGKKLDTEKAKVSATKMEKKSEGRKQDPSRPDGDMPEAKSSANERTEKEDKEDDKDVSFCMWGHEDCRTRSHYRYNWQWDYVQKYVDHHNKNIIQGYKPKEEKVSKYVETPLVAEPPQDPKKPGKEGIQIRLQMLQNRLTHGSTSGSMKQKMFERDLELEMLRRKKTYKF